MTSCDLFDLFTLEFVTFVTLLNHSQLMGILDRVVLFRFSL